MSDFDEYFEYGDWVNERGLACPNGLTMLWNIKQLFWNFSTIRRSQLRQSVSYTESIKATTMTMTGIVEMYWIIDVVPHGGTCMENQTKCVKWYDKIMQLHGDRVNILIALVVKRVQIHFSLLEKSCHSNIKNHGVTSLLRSAQLVSPVTQTCHYWVAHPSLKYSCFNSISNIFKNKLNIFPHKQHLFSYYHQLVILLILSTCSCIFLLNVFLLFVIEKYHVVFVLFLYTKCVSFSKLN